MKKVLSLMICGMLILSIAGVASAGKQTGLYIGASAGSADLEVDQTTIKFDDSDTGYKVFGGYNFGIIPFLDLAVEGSYVDFGKISDIQILNRNVGVTAWDLFGVGCINLGPVGIFAKVGQAWWKSDTNFNVLDDKGNDPVYGLGVKFQIMSIAVRAEYERLDTDVADIDFVSAGVSWTF